VSDAIASRPVAPSPVAASPRAGRWPATELPPVLLGDATWWGTLAAARDLGSRGVSVTLASDARIAPARWSRHVDRVVRCPGHVEPARVLQWLLEFGKRFPGHVLYPTSDELAWLLAAHREELGACFRLYSPRIEALACLLDKKQLGEAASTSGLCVPEAWSPVDEEEVLRLGEGATFPLYVKPRTQVFGSGHGKGQLVERRAELLSAWRAWHSPVRYPADVAQRMPGVDRPLLQASYPGSDRVFTVDGFVDETGELFCTLGCVKVLQWPRGSGPGICFEHAVVPASIDEGLSRLFRRVGFYGVFDAEFIEHAGSYLLIDVNPRFYNHMAFEVERGLPLPWMAYLAALGDREALHAAVESARRSTSGPRVYVHPLPLRMMLQVQALTRGMSLGERKYWRSWLSMPEGTFTDPARQDGDNWPAVVEVALEIGRSIRHPRAYFRHLASQGPRATKR
jgi:D-aspartate ligase